MTGLHPYSRPWVEAGVPVLKNVNVNDANSSWTCGVVNPSSDDWIITYPTSENG